MSTSGAKTAGRSLLVTAGYDQTIRVWNHETGACSRIFQHEKSQVNCMAIHPDKTILAVGGYQRVSFYKINSDDERPVVVLNKENSNLLKNIVSIGYQEEGSWIFTASEDKTVRLWDMRSTHIDCSEMFTHSNPISCAVLHPNQNHFLIGDELGNLIKWDKRTNTTETIMTEPKSAIRSISINSEGTLMAAVNNEGSCFMWTITGAFSDGSTMRIVQRDSVFQPHRRYALKCLFSPDSTLLATSSADGTAKIYYSASRALKTECRAANQKWVWDLAFTSDSKCLFTASSSNTAAENGQFLGRKWSVDSGQVLSEYQGHEQPVVSLAFSDI